MKKLSINGPILILVAAALWAMDGIVRRSLYVLPPIIIVFFEHFVGAILLTPLVVKGFKKEKLSKLEWGAVGTVALLSSLLGTLWFTTALLMTSYISFSVVFLLQKLQPLFAVVTARIVLKEKINKRYALWAAIALIAAYFITFPKGVVNFSTGDKTVLAALFALGSAIAWGSTTAFSRYTLLKHDDKFITGLRFGITTLLALVAVFILNQQSKLFTVTWSQFGQFTFIALSTGMVALLIYYKGLKTTSVRVSTILELTFPLIAVFIDVILYKTVISPIQVIAAVVLLFAMYQTTRFQKI
ncbi:EamA family transporter [Candidatus Roizmanbacteria bacterium CG03_land_8_20_14_0_80_39_12]|uniref:EamA family transporter n=2 Tax=Candidatus Roizmaniibacteriota TaxID=1752723 RepID=A0A2M7BQX2_9BACT|nr:MAG: EamA family transporter [Candidatus Roizmanbacteria bacterium CG03_land_8_20_14_0_80_39_12]